MRAARSILLIPPIAKALALALTLPLSHGFRAVAPPPLRPVRRGASARPASFLEDLFSALQQPPSEASPSPPPPIETSRVRLSSGTLAEILTSVPPPWRRRGKPPLAFVHGSFHAAWCWAEFWFPFFASRGYPVSALSLRGTGGTPAGEGVRKVKIDEHVDDVSSFLSHVADDDGLGLGVADATARKPVLISHSFGGLAAMKYLERYPETAPKGLSGVATLCSVPPSGNGPMTMRYLRRSLSDSWKITAGMAMKKCNTDASLCRTLFFGGDKVVRDDGTVDYNGVSDEDVARYQSYFTRDTEAMIDLTDLSRRLPSAKADVDGMAPFAQDLPPVLVVGASDDFIVDREGVEETARYFGVSPMMVDSPHDVMLGRRWQNGADTILRWLEKEVCSA